MLDTRTPVTLLTGFLGAGKTTLLNRMLCGNHGQRIAVVVNEFGEVPIDGALVRQSDDQLVELSNGCVCCTVRGDLQRTVLDLLARRERLVLPLSFDRVVIEASGLADPGPVVQTFLIEPELSRRTAVDGVIALADARHIEAQLQREDVAANQLAYADVILLNHTDELGEDAVSAAEDVVRGVAALAQVQRTVRAAIEVGELFGMGDARHSTGGTPAPRGGHGHGHGHGHGIDSVSLVHVGAVDIHRLKMWLHFLASRKTHELIRLKGIFRCPGRPVAVVAQGVYQTLELGPSELPPPDASSLVLIGRNLDVEELTRGWQNVCKS